MDKPFQFKEFKVHQDKTAMKIGTDGVLLGAWCSVDNFPEAILDVGSGTGIIALMLAQRSDSMTIDAVEIDENGYEQSVENFEQSDWGDRLYCYNSSFQEFAEEIAEEQETYDLIVTNPPFYTDDFETKNDARNKARFVSSLPFEDLIKNAVKILSDDGKFSLIVPFKEEQEIIRLSNEHSLFLNRKCTVQGNSNSEIKRVLLEFSFRQVEIISEHLIIEIERHQYTKEYINLTKNFYLKM